MISVLELLIHNRPWTNGWFTAASLTDQRSARPRHAIEDIIQEVFYDDDRYGDSGSFAYIGRRCRMDSLRLFST